MTTVTGRFSESPMLKIIRGMDEVRHSRPCERPQGPQDESVGNPGLGIAEASNGQGNRLGLRSSLKCRDV